MRTFRIKYLLILIITMGLIAGAAGLTWADMAQLTIQSDTVNLGDTVQMSLAVNGTTSASIPKMKAIKGLDIQYLGPATQIQIINGKLSQSITYNFLVNTLQAGKYTLGPYTVQTGSKKTTTNSVMLTVIGAGTSNSATGNQPTTPKTVPETAGNDLFLTMSVPRNILYLGEEVPATIKLYVGDIKVDELSYPQLNQSEFVVGKMPEPEKTHEIVNGTEYQVLTFQTKITPVKTGELVLGPVQLSCVKLVPDHSSDPFDDFFSNYTKQPVNLRSKTIKMTVADLPSMGKPQNFSGGIGQFQLNVTAGPDHVAQGDPVTVKMHIEGDGNLQTIAPPQLKDVSGLKVYDAARKNTSSPEQSSPSGVDYEQIVIPISPSVKQIGPFVFSYFDPAIGRYRELLSPVIPLTVKPNPNFKPDTVLNDGKGSVEREHLGRDLIYIKEKPGGLRRAGQPLAKKPLFWIVQLIPLLGLIGSFTYQKQHQRLQADTPEARMIRAGAKAAKELERVKKALDGGKTDGILDDLHRIVREYLAEKYNLPAAGMTRNVVGDLLGENIDDAVLKAIDNFFAGYDFYRFAGSRLTDQTGYEFFETVQKIVESLNNFKGTPKRAVQQTVQRRNGKA